MKLHSFILGTTPNTATTVAPIPSIVYIGFFSGGVVVGAVSAIGVIPVMRSSAATVATRLKIIKFTRATLVFGAGVFITGAVGKLLLNYDIVLIYATFLVGLMVGFFFAWFYEDRRAERLADKAAALSEDRRAVIANLIGGGPMNPETLNAALDDIADGEDDPRGAGDGDRPDQPEPEMPPR